MQAFVDYAVMETCWRVVLCLRSRREFGAGPERGPSEPDSEAVLAPGQVRARGGRGPDGSLFKFQPHPSQPGPRRAARPPAAGVAENPGPPAAVG
jgi:hypothetical protein